MATGSNQRGQLGNADKILDWPKPVHTNEYSEHPDFSCFMVRWDFFDDVGTFDENFIPAYFEDNDMHYRIRLLGKLAISTSNAPYLHYGSVTQNGGDSPAVPGHLFDLNRDYMMQKWGSTDAWNIVNTHPYGNETLTPRDWMQIR